jgi:hypothetical protein
MSLSFDAARAVNELPSDSSIPRCSATDISPDAVPVVTEAKTANIHRLRATGSATLMLT